LAFVIAALGLLTIAPSAQAERTVYPEIAACSIEEGAIGTCATPPSLGPDESGNAHRTLVKFAVPASSPELGTLARATLSAEDGNSHNARYTEPVVYRITRPWTMPGVDWFSADTGQAWDAAGGDYAEATQLAPFSNDGSSVAFDITAIVKSWQAGTPNNGVLLADIAPEFDGWQALMVSDLSVELEYTKDDNFAPEILLGDVLSERDGGYAGVGTLPLTISADDASPASGTGEPVSGVSSLKLLQGATVVASASAPCASGCPATFAQQFSVNTATLAEGMNALSVEATDASANTESEPLDLIVDKTAPAPPTQVHLEDFNADDETVRLDWAEGEDPDLADGEPGAGTKYTEYRRQDANGNWGEWHRFQEASDTRLANVSENETLHLELRSIDAVGNYSTVYAVTLAAEPDDEAPAGRREVDFPCSLDLDYMRTVRQDPDYDAFIPEWTRLGAQLKLTCYIGEPRLDKVEIRGKLARYNPGSDTYTDLTSEVLVVEEMPVGATQVGPIKRKIRGFHRRCNSSMTGSRRYVVRGTVKYVYRGAADDTDDFTTDKGTNTCPSLESLIAAEHKGWRTLTKRAFHPLPGDPPTTSPGTHLRRSLNRSAFSLDHTPYVPEGLTDIQAWTPHHVVPVSPNYASVIGAFRNVQALMFRACIHPNDAVNGIFLRNRALIRRNEDGSENPYYEELKEHDEPASKRTYHYDTYNARYIGIVNGAFVGAVNVYNQNSQRESGNEPCDAVGVGSGVDVSSRLGGLTGLLLTGTMPLTKHPR
jgi:hypothetical protein